MNLFASLSKWMVGSIAFTKHSKIGLNAVATVSYCWFASYGCIIYLVNVSLLSGCPFCLCPFGLTHTFTNISIHLSLSFWPCLLAQHISLSVAGSWSAWKSLRFSRTVEPKLKITESIEYKESQMRFCFLSDMH